MMVGFPFQYEMKTLHYSFLLYIDLYHFWSEMTKIEDFQASIQQFMTHMVGGK
jgi:hypothetical protein